MNPRKAHGIERSTRRRAIKSTNHKNQGWKGSDPAVRDAKRKIRKLFKSTSNGGNGR